MISAFDEVISAIFNHNFQEMMRMKNIFCKILVLCLLAASLTACSGTLNETANSVMETAAGKTHLCSAPIQHETKFGGAAIKISIEDFLNLGFEFGDSVDVIFSGGWKIEDIPFYNGYYVRKGTPLLAGAEKYLSDCGLDTGEVADFIRKVSRRASVKSDGGF